MIKITNLSKQFDSQFVVHDVNLKITQGEIVGLLGPNGAGKTTTLRMIAGVLPSTAGDIEIDGQNIKNNDSFKTRIGFLPENNPLFDEMTVEEYLDFWIHIKGIARDKKKEAVDFVVDNCAIGEVFYRPISELSKGFRQRVGLSQAILTRPDILILDEPTEGLDPNQRQDIAELIRNLGKKRTVIISSHVLSEITRIAGRLVVIHKGRIVADDTPENLKKSGSKTSTIMAEIKGSGIAKILKKLKDVLEVKEQNNGFFEIRVDKKTDIREKIFDTAVSHKWKLLTLVQKEREIEDVFSQLTSQ